MANGIEIVKTKPHKDCVGCEYWEGEFSKEHDELTAANKEIERITNGEETSSIKIDGTIYAVPEGIIKFVEKTSSNWQKDRESLVEAQAELERLKTPIDEHCPVCGGYIGELIDDKDGE